jgi:hypothetical protein
MDAPEQSREVIEKDSGRYATYQIRPLAILQITIPENSSRSFEAGSRFRARE